MPTAPTAATKLGVINQGTETVILYRICPFCGKDVRKEVPSKEFYQGIDKYQSGSTIQAAFPSFDSDTREMILTGICSECWNDM